MGQQVMHGERPGGRIEGQPGEIRPDGTMQIQFAFVMQLHQAQGEK